MEELPSIKLFGVKITNASEEEILEYILRTLQSGHKKLFIVTPNPEFIMYARTHPEFKKILNEADLALADGVGVAIAARLLGMGKLPRTTGTDLLEKLSSRLAKSPYSTGFLGGQGGVAKLTSECLQEKYSGLKVNYAFSDWDEKRIKAKKIDVLFVAMGYPLQEKWIYENLSKKPIQIAMGVGGAFDYISGKVGRAPKFLRTIGLEWLYRLVRQPWRIKRQLALLSFILLTFKEMVRLGTSSKN